MEQHDLQKCMDQLNEIYYPLEMKAHQMLYGLHHRIFSPQLTYCSGHRVMDEAGKLFLSYFPLPMITVPGYCDVVIHLDHVEVESKLSRAKVLENSFEKLVGHAFAVYGDEDYTRQFYGNGITILQMKASVWKSEEKQLRFSFRLDFDIDGDYIYEFVKLLRRQGFHD